MNKYADYIVKNSVYGEANRPLSQAFGIFCDNQHKCTHCKLDINCPIGRQNSMTDSEIEELVAILGWTIERKELI